MADHKAIGIVETDMAILADAAVAMNDLEGWLLSLPYRQRVTTEDAMRVEDDLYRLAAGLHTIRKYLALLRSSGWAEEEG